METTDGTEAPDIDHYESDPEVKLMEEVCRHLRAIPLNASQALPFDQDTLRRAISRHMGRNARLMYSLSEGGVVLRSSRPAIAPMGRPMRAGTQAALQDIEGIKPGQTATVYGHSRTSIQQAVAKLKRKNGAALRVSYSDSQPDAAKVTRVDGIFTTDGYGNTVDMANLAERTPYPFRAMRPGDRFTAAADAHGGIESMRSICSRFTKRIGHIFRAAQNTDGSITVTCTYRPDVWVSEQRHNEVQNKLKHQKPQVISEIWE